MRALVPLLILLPSAACSVEGAVEPPPPAERPIPPPTRLDAPARVVALGDIHGDIEAMRATLRLGDLIDDDDHWIGGETVVVQTGDQLDRGDDEREILHVLDRLADEAHAAGGLLLTLNGNHEAMNVELDLRYVTDGGWEDFADLAPPEAEQDAELLDWEEHERGRVAAFRPGGVYARLLARQNTVAVVGDTVFVHGGIHPEHAAWGLENINRDVSRWMRGEGDEPTAVIDGEGPLWSRAYSDGPGEEECALLDDVFADLDVTRMVVGHTVQTEPTVACYGRVWRIDVGMAAYYGGTPALIEIVDDEVRVID